MPKARPVMRWWTLALGQLALSAGLLTLTIANSGWFWLGWLALWPVFHLLEQNPGLGRRAVLGLIWLFLISQFGFPYAVATAYHHLGGNPPAAWLMGTTLGVITSLRYFAFVVLARWSPGRWWTWPAAWSACELFIWQMMPVYGSVHVLGDRPFVQWAEWLGAPGLSWLWFCLSLGLYETVRGRAPAKISLGLLLAVHLVGWARLAQWQARSAAWPRHSIAIIQGNQPANLQTTMEVAQEARRRMLEQTQLFLQSLQTRPALVVWPEASLPLVESGKLEGFQLRYPLLFTDFEPGTQAGYVIARALDIEGHSLASYRKRKLILMGEWTPWDKAHSLQVGEQDTLLPTPVGPVLPLICFEGLWPGFVASFHRHTGAEARWLVYLGSESSFGSDLCCRQSLHLATLRTVELRRPLVRANNSGISGWIDCTGRLHQATRTFTPQAEVLEVAMPEQPEWTLYARWGDIPVYLAIVLGAALGWRRKEP